MRYTKTAGEGRREERKRRRQEKKEGRKEGWRKEKKRSSEERKRGRGGRKEAGRTKKISSINSFTMGHYATYFRCKCTLRNELLCNGSTKFNESELRDYDCKSEFTVL